MTGNAITNCLLCADSVKTAQWAAKMKEIGLQPSTTGRARRQGNRTERDPLHRRRRAIREAYATLKARGFQLRWQSLPAGPQAKAKRASKTKFTCPDCAQNAWAKPDALLICGVCYEDGEGDLRLMLAEPTDEADAA